MKLQAVGLRGAAGLAPSALSGGMARRVALARAIAMDPELLIYYEPFVGLDPISLGVIFFFQAEDGIRDHCVTGVQTCALPICEECLRRPTFPASWGRSSA